MAVAGDDTAPIQDTPGMPRALNPRPAAAAAGGVNTAQNPTASPPILRLQLDDLMQLPAASPSAAAVAAGGAAGPPAAATPGPQQPEASHAAAEAGQCPICLEDLAGLTLHVYPCGHTFCDACSTKVCTHINERHALLPGIVTR